MVTTLLSINPVSYRSNAEYIKSGIDTLYTTIVELNSNLSETQTKHTDIIDHLNELGEEKYKEEWVALTSNSSSTDINSKINLLLGVENNDGEDGEDNGDNNGGNVGDVDPPTGEEPSTPSWSCTECEDTDEHVHCPYCSEKFETEGEMAGTHDCQKEKLCEYCNGACDKAKAETKLRDLAKEQSISSRYIDSLVSGKYTISYNAFGGVYRIMSGSTVMTTVTQETYLVWEHWKSL